MSALRSICARAASAIASEHLGAPADPAELRRRVDALGAYLHGQLGVWIGTDGCAVLLRRAWSRAAIDHPVLASLSLRPAAPHVDWPAVDPAIAEVLPAFTAFLTHAFDHLGRLVGDEVAGRLLLPNHLPGWADEPALGDE